MDSNETEQDVQRMQITIEQAQEQVRLGEALTRLNANADWKLLIVNDYLKDQTVRLGHLLADHNMQGEQHRGAIIKDIEAVGNFLNYLRLIERRSLMARQAIMENEQELDAIAEEESATAE